MIVVPDASVILKWVLEKEDEPGYSQALKLQEALLAEEIEIRMPTLWRYEVGNVLGMKKPRMAVELMSALLAYEFDEVPLGSEYALDIQRTYMRYRVSHSMILRTMSWPCGRRGYT